MIHHVDYLLLNKRALWESSFVIHHIYRQIHQECAAVNRSSAPRPSSPLRPFALHRLSVPSSLRRLSVPPPFAASSSLRRPSVPPPRPPLLGTPYKLLFLCSWHCSSTASSASSSPCLAAFRYHFMAVSSSCSTP